MIIYSLIDPRSAEVRYVGQTVGPANRRLRRHLSECSGETHKERWIRSLAALGLAPTIEVIET
jgi:hypothetical protein